MEHLLSDTALAGELQSVKTTAELLASQKLRYPHNYVPPVEDRHRRATLVNVPVVEPPSTAADDDEAGPSTATIRLTIKSLKPPLSFSLDARPTASIADLKHQLAQAQSAAPPADQQRWLLKGKALADAKLLKEYPVEDGSVVTLMVAKSAASTPAASVPVRSPNPAAASSSSDDPSDAPAVPALTLSEPSTSSAPAPQLSLSTDLDHLPLSTSTSADNPAVVGESDSFLTTVASPELWEDVRELTERQFGKDSKEAQKVWEAMFAGCRDWIRPNQKALVRERVGYSAMGGV
ncbi:hypothetical protein JCM8097_002411 [Rhodosporidiobolus ruineniae]